VAAGATHDRAFSERAVSENVHHRGGEGEKQGDFGKNPLTGRPARPIFPEADHIALNRGIDKHGDTCVDPAVEIHRRYFNRHRSFPPEWLPSFPPSIHAADPDISQHVIGESCQIMALLITFHPGGHGIEYRYQSLSRWVHLFTMTAITHANSTGHLYVVEQFFHVSLLIECREVIEFRAMRRIRPAFCSGRIRKPCFRRTSLREFYCFSYFRRSRRHAGTMLSGVFEGLICDQRL
jgi:hypothetical protein